MCVCICVFFITVFLLENFRNFKILREKMGNGENKQNTEEMISLHRIKGQPSDWVTQGVIFTDSCSRSYIVCHSCHLKSSNKKFRDGYIAEDATSFWKHVEENHLGKNGEQLPSTPKKVTNQQMPDNPAKEYKSLCTPKKRTIGKVVEIIVIDDDDDDDQQQQQQKQAKVTSMHNTIDELDIELSRICGEVYNTKMNVCADNVGNTTPYLQPQIKSENDIVPYVNIPTPEESLCDDQTAVKWTSQQQQNNEEITDRENLIPTPPRIRHQRSETSQSNKIIRNAVVSSQGDLRIRLSWSADNADTLNNNKNQTPPLTVNNCAVNAEQNNTQNLSPSHLPHLDRPLDKTYSDQSISQNQNCLNELELDLPLRQSSNNINEMQIEMSNQTIDVTCGTQSSTERLNTVNPNREPERSPQNLNSTSSPQFSINTILNYSRHRAEPSKGMEFANDNQSSTYNINCCSNYAQDDLSSLNAQYSNENIQLPEYQSSNFLSSTNSHPNSQYSAGNAQQADHQSPMFLSSPNLCSTPRQFSIANTHQPSTYQNLNYSSIASSSYTSTPFSSMNSSQTSEYEISDFLSLTNAYPSVQFSMENIQPSYQNFNYSQSPNAQSINRTYNPIPTSEYQSSNYSVSATSNGPLQPPPYHQNPYHKNSTPEQTSSMNGKQILPSSTQCVLKYKDFREQKSKQDKKHTKQSTHGIKKTNPTTENILDVCSSSAASSKTKSSEGKTTGEKNVESETATKSGKIKKRRSTYHDRPYKCSHCWVRCSSEKSKEVHTNNYHCDDSKTTCRHCQKTVNTHTYEKHVKNVHGKSLTNQDHSKIKIIEKF